MEGGTKCCKNTEEILYLGVLEKVSWSLAPKDKTELVLLVYISRQSTLTVPGAGKWGTGMYLLSHAFREGAWAGGRAGHSDISLCCQRVT